MEKNVQLKYRLYRRRNGVFYWQENDSSKQGTLRTSDRREAERLLNAMNESHREPTLNLNLARAYLAAHDPKMAQRSWQAVMDEMATHGIPTTQERCARGFRSQAYDSIRSEEHTSELQSHSDLVCRLLLEKKKKKYIKTQKTQTNKRK